MKRGFPQKVTRILQGYGLPTLRVGRKRHILRSGWANVRRLALALACLAAMPYAAAASADIGFFVADGPIHVPSDSELVWREAFVFWPDVPEDTVVEVHADHVLVEHYQFQSQGVDDARYYLSNDSSRYRLTNVTVTVQESDGWMATYPTASGAVTSLLDSDARLVASEPDRLGNGDASSEEQDGGTPFVWQTFARPHMQLDAAGRMQVEGGLSWKLSGSTVVLSASENTTTIRTGSFASAEGLPTQRTDSWLVLRLSNARGSMAAGAYAAAAPAVAGNVQGALSFHAVHGALATANGTFTASDEPTVLTGAYDVDFAPTTAGSGGPGVALQMEGQIHAATLARAPVPADSLASRAGWFWLGVGTLLGAGGVGIAVAARAKQRQKSLGLDECVDMMHAAANEGRYGDALDWNRRAQAFAPRNPRLKADRGWYLSRLGDVEGALREYDEASRLDEEGQADFLAAVLLLETDQPMELVVPRVVRALERTPGLALEIQDDGLFRRVVAHPLVERAMRDALRRVD